MVNQETMFCSNCIDFNKTQAEDPCFNCLEDNERSYYQDRRKR